MPNNFPTFQIRFTMSYGIKFTIPLEIGTLQIEHIMKIHNVFQVEVQIHEKVHKVSPAKIAEESMSDTTKINTSNLNSKLFYMTL